MEQIDPLETDLFYLTKILTDLRTVLSYEEIIKQVNKALLYGEKDDDETV